MSERIAIYGAGGLGREILQVVREMRAGGARDVECAAFIVDEPFATADVVQGVPVYRDFRVLAADETIQFVVAIGDPAARARIARIIENAIGARFATVVHPSALIGGSVSVGVGSMVMGLTSLTTECRLGRHVLINPGCTVAHDNVIEDFATLSPGVNLAGRVRVGEGCLLGIGACVVPDINLGRWSVVGAAACVIRDVAANTVAAGVPAQTIAARHVEAHTP
jgi:sugar O-acyltransferase (sialic acid O-acetyltransferase NeuD family)